MQIFMGNTGIILASNNDQLAKYKVNQAERLFAVTESKATRRSRLWHSPDTGGAAPRCAAVSYRTSGGAAPVGHSILLTRAPCTST